jgi:hypothetical protein
MLGSILSFSSHRTPGLIVSTATFSNCSLSRNFYKIK